MFPLLLGLENEEGYHKSLHPEELRNKLNIIFPPFQHKYMTG
jgi:hypothetical protein